MKFANPGNGDSVVALARNPERAVDDAVEDAAGAVVEDAAGAVVEDATGGAVEGVTEGAAQGAAEEATIESAATPESDSSRVDAVPSSENEQGLDASAEAPDAPERDATGGNE
jgi:DNA gyrase subunit A